MADAPVAEEPNGPALASDGLPQPQSDEAAEPGNASNGSGSPAAAGASPASSPAADAAGARAAQERAATVAEAANTVEDAIARSACRDPVAADLDPKDAAAAEAPQDQHVAIPPEIGDPEAADPGPLAHGTAKKGTKKRKQPSAVRMRPPCLHCLPCDMAELGSQSLCFCLPHVAILIKLSPGAIVLASGHRRHAVYRVEVCRHLCGSPGESAALLRPSCLTLLVQAQKVRQPCHVKTAFWWCCMLCHTVCHLAMCLRLMPCA